MTKDRELPRRRARDRAKDQLADGAEQEAEFRKDERRRADRQRREAQKKEKEATEARREMARRIRKAHDGRASAAKEDSSSEGEVSLADELGAELDGLHSEAREAGDNIQSRGKSTKGRGGTGSGGGRGAKAGGDCCVKLTKGRGGGSGGFGGGDGIGGSRAGREAEMADDSSDSPSVVVVDVGSGTDELQSDDEDVDECVVSTATVALAVFAHFREEQDDAAERFEEAHGASLQGPALATYRDLLGQLRAVVDRAEQDWAPR
ncbi:hypothetical protein JCM10450v2_002051 [Rhodotorula kratochvilovae]